MTDNLASAKCERRKKNRTYFSLFNVTNVTENLNLWFDVGKFYVCESV